MTSTITAQSRWDDHTIKNRYRVHRSRGHHHGIVQASGLTEAQLNDIIDDPRHMTDEHIALLRSIVPPWDNGKNGPPKINGL